MMNEQKIQLKTSTLNRLFNMKNNLLFLVQAVIIAGIGLGTMAASPIPTGYARLWGEYSCNCESAQATCATYDGNQSGCIAIDHCTYNNIFYKCYNSTCPLCVPWNSANCTAPGSYLVVDPACTLNNNTNSGGIDNTNSTETFGDCGFANGANLLTAPTSRGQKCIEGTSSAISEQWGDTPAWRWSCTGNSSRSYCSANRMVNGVCDNTTTFACTAGTSADNVTGVCGGSATWSCNGINTGTNATNCTKPNGACSDAVAPSVTITDPITTPKEYPLSAYIIRGVASDNAGGSGLSSVKIRVNGGSWGNTTSGMASWTYNLAMMAGQTYLVEAQAFDLAGNASIIDSRTIKYVVSSFYIVPDSLIIYNADGTTAVANQTTTLSGTVVLKPKVIDTTANKTITVFVNVVPDGTTLQTFLPKVSNADDNNNPSCVSGTNYGTAFCPSYIWYSQSTADNWTTGYQPTITIPAIPNGQYTVQVVALTSSGSPSVPTPAGYAAAETFGYIDLSGLTITPGAFPSGNIQGYAVSESLGYISFRSGTPTSCTAQDATNYGVLIQNDNKLCGYAYSESIGWISFNDNQASIVSNAIVGFASSEAAGWIQF